MNLTVLELFEIYQEVCEETEMEWTLEGWNFFDKVMVKDYEGYCKAQNVEPNLKSFKRNCVAIAKEMKDQAM